MADQYFYSDLAECAGCDKHLVTANCVGAIELTAPGKPRILYATCKTCAKKLRKRQVDFITRLEDRVVQRARELGAFSKTEPRIDVRFVGGSDE